jgi:hypothetical protein
VGSLWSGILLFQNRSTVDLAVVTPPAPTPNPPPPPTMRELPVDETSTSKPVQPVKPVSPVSPKKTAPVFRGGEVSGTIRLTPDVQCLQGSEIQPVTGIQAPVEVKCFTVSAAGEIWKIGLTGTRSLKMVSGNSGFILPTESGPVTVLFSSPLTQGKTLFGTRIGTAAAGAASISIPPSPLKQ